MILKYGSGLELILVCFEMLLPSNEITTAQGLTTDLPLLFLRKKPPTGSEREHWPRVCCVTNRNHFKIWNHLIVMTFWCLSILATLHICQTLLVILISNTSKKCVISSQTGRSFTFKLSRGNSNNNKRLVFVLIGDLQQLQLFACFYQFVIVEKFRVNCQLCPSKIDVEIWQAWHN